MVQWMAADFVERDIPSPRLDAELLVAHSLGHDRVGLYLDLERPLNGDELTAIRGLVKRRRSHEPVAYILGKREFVGRPFDVDPAVLIPRPDTETLIERALSLLPKEEPARLADLCTGSGCIAITLAAERPECEVDASDLSAEALVVAERNRARHGVEARVQLRQGDLWDALPAEASYDLIASNPPYVTESEWAGLSPDVRAHEPRIALVGGADGLDFYRRLAEHAADRLVRGGHLLLEVGQGQAPAVEEMLHAAGLAGVRSHDDLGGIARVVEAVRPG